MQLTAPCDAASKTNSQKSSSDIKNGQIMYDEDQERHLIGFIVSW